MTNTETVKTYYYDGFFNSVDKETKQAVQSGLKKVKNKIEPSFFKNISIHVTTNYSDLKGEKTSIKYIKNRKQSKSLGCTIKGYKDVYIQERAFLKEKFDNLCSSTFSFSAYKLIENTTAHELGHLFDYNYVTDSNNETHHTALKILNNLYNNKKNQLPHDVLKKILLEFENTNSYSDSKEFKNALKKDINCNNDIDKYLEKFWYYLEYLFEYQDDSNSEKAYISRGEIFAQLFSYAMGTDDGNKEEFIKLLPNTYTIVCNFIEKHKKTERALDVKY